MQILKNEQQNNDFKASSTARLWTRSRSPAPAAPSPTALCPFQLSSSHLSPAVTARTSRPATLTPGLPLEMTSKARQSCP